MSLPSPLLSVPSLSSDQIQFQGLVMGSGTVFGLVSLEGLGQPDARSGNTDRPRTRGAFVGLNLLKTRVITATLDVGPLASNFGGYGNLATALAALRTACSTSGTTEYPLWINLPNFPFVACMARVIKGFDPKYDYTADRGLVRGVAIQFEATDPYVYAAPTTSTSISLPTPGTGLAFPLSFPISFGGGASPNMATITNSGDVECWPVLVITGPCSNPVVQNLSIAGNPSININLNLNAGDTLTIDCDQQSILYQPSGQTVGAPYPQILNSGSTFFSLPPGNSVIAFNSSDSSHVSGTVAVWSSSAWDGLT